MKFCRVAPGLVPVVRPSKMLPFSLLMIPFLIPSSLPGLSARQTPEVEGLVLVEGGQLYYKEAGEGPPVILIHGGFLDHRMWGGQVQALAGAHRVVRYDVRSHGRSHAEPVPFSDMEDLAALMDALAIPRATIVGLSMGGQIATDFALLYPDRVEGLVLVGPGMSGFPFDSPELGRYMEELREAIARDDLQEVTEVFTRYWCDGPYRAPADVNPEVRSRVLEMLAGSEERWKQGGYVESLDPPAMGRLSTVRAPTLVVLGLLDMPDIHQIVDRLAADVPNIRRVEIPGVAHMVNMEAPGRFNEVLIRFLGELSPAHR